MRITFRPPAPPPVGDRAWERAEFAATGLLAGREELRTGVYRATVVIEDLFEGEIPIREEYTVSSGFDAPAGRLRFDGEDPRRIGLPVGVPPGEMGMSRAELDALAARADAAPHETRVVTHTFRSIILPDRRYQWERPGDGHGPWADSGSQWVVVELPTGPKLQHPVWAPRALGLWFANVLAYPAHLTAEDLLGGAFTRPNLESFEQLSDHVVRLTLRTENIRTRFYLDTRRGYSPIRLEDARWDGRSAWETVNWTDVAWERVSDAWVPVSITGESREPPIHPVDMKVAFDWLSVNEPVPDRMFSPSDFADVDPMTEIVDYRLGEPFVVGTLEAPTRPPGWSAFPTEPARRPWWESTLWILTVVTVLGAGGWWWVRLRRPTGNGPNTP